MITTVRAFGNFLLQREDVFEEKLREASAKEFASEGTVVKAS